MSHCSFLAVESRWCHASRYLLEEQPVDLKIVRVDRLSSVPPRPRRWSRIGLAHNQVPAAPRSIHQSFSREDPVVDRVLSPTVVVL
jgi:hypothetical protein